MSIKTFEKVHSIILASTQILRVKGPASVLQITLGQTRLPQVSQTEVLR